MSIDKAVTRFERLLGDVKNIMPTVVLSDGSVGYFNYIVRKNKLGQWDLIQHGKRYRNSIACFYLKTSALIAAKQHKNNRIMEFSRTKDMDQRYWNNYTDSIHFKQRFAGAKDELKRDVFLWRYEQSRDRSQWYRNEITQVFNHSFR